MHVLVCDFMELYRYLVDDFLVEYCRNLKPKDFTVKTENIGRKKQEKREYLNNTLAQKLLKQLDNLFGFTVELPRIKVGTKQTFETLINEEALLFAKYLRNERKEWNPRMAII